MLLKQDLPIITDKDVQAVDFFYDFIAFLNRLKERPIKRTVTGNISLTDIKELLPQLRTAQYKIKEHQEFGWKLNSENHLQTLTQMKVIAEVMHITYKRKDKLLLSKNGQAFLKNLSSVQQYEQMVLYYWYRTNWEYFTPSVETDGITLAELIQGKQNYFWLLFLQKGMEWMNFDKFCKITRDYFNLQPFFEDSYLGPDYELLSDMDFILFRSNLMIFGCVEVENTTEKREWQRKIVKFRSTSLGLHIFYKALNENYL